MINTITLQKATIEDCDTIYCWRNDPTTREQSFNSREILYEKHSQWLKKALEDPKKFFYIGIDEKGKKYGVVRFDIKSKFSAEINIIVAPDKRGKGIASQLILKSCSLFFSETKRKLILARIKESNSASVRAFQKVGFSKLFHYKEEDKERILALVLLAPDRRIR
ncbi:MAG: GNAT family N-acetyltransferase [bacterium]|nr:GNAT family N-acetyltransferase [bacterium]